LTTADNAITSVGPQSQLTLSGTLRQDGANAILNVTTSEDNEPVIQAERATLAGTLNIAGFSSQTYATASTLPSSVFNIIETNNGITGDFSRVVIGNTIDPIDYLAVIGGLSDNNKNYTVGVQLAWTANNEDATGTFTISGTDQFEVDVALQNQSLPSGNSWNGEDLTKKGTGTLVLSAGDTYNSKNSSRNTYTGVTDIQAGTLLTGDSNVFQNSSNIIVGQNAVLDMAGHDQSAQSLSGSGSILLGNGTLSVGSNEVGAGDSNFGGSIRGGGALRKIGNTTLTLSGTSEFSGGTEVSGGTLVLQAGSAAGTGVLNAANGTTVQLDIAANQTETFINRITGNGDLSKIGDGTALLTATNMEVADVDVREGTLALGSSANLNLTGTYTQENDTTLEIAIGTNEPAITADSANLDGDLVITGFDSSTYSSASSFLGRTFVVVDSVSNISGEFSNVTIANAGVEVDFLTIDGRINPDDDTEYIVGFGLQWYAGVPLSHGNFTIGPDDIFTLDQQLRDVQANTTTQWDGKSLTKLSGGTLVLAPDSGTGESHEYTGVTDIQAGTLRMGMENAIQESERVNVAGGGTFDLNGYDQNVKGISGTGTILLGNGELSVGANNPVSTDSTFAGAIRGDGSLRVTGGHTLTLSGRSDYTGGTTVADGTLVLQNGSAAGTGAINTAAGSTLNLAVDTTQTFANVLSGPGTVIKTGTGTAVLTGSDSTGTAVAGDVDVQTGSITLAQNGEFRAQSYHIHSKAGTSISADASMRLEDEFVQESGATLGVALGADPDTAKITAGTADIAGAIYVTGFDATALPASVLTANRHTVLETTQANGITGDFSSVDFGGQLASVDYLVLNGTLNNTQDKYTVGFDLAWYAGPAEGTGSFTIADGTGFEVDVLLEDRDPAIPFASGWNGRDLTKNGDGTLTLSHANTYSGATTVTGGTLRLTETNALGRSNSLTMADGATVDIQSSSQTVGVLDSQTGSVLNLNDGGLVLDSNQSEGGRRDNVIDGTLQGNGTLSLTDADLTGTSDNADYRGDVVASLRSASGSTITLNNVHGLGDSGNLFFNRSEDSLVFAEAAGTGAFSKRMHGEGSVTLEDGTDVTISGNNVNFGGAFTVDDGATMRAGAADNLGTAGIRVNGALHLSSAADASWRREKTVTGAGDFVKDGDGRLVLGTSMSDFTGDARVAAGTLVVGDGTDVDAVLGSLQVEVDEGASLSGTGTVDGAVHNRGSIASLNAIAGYERAAPSNLTIGPLTNAGTIRLAGNAVGNTLTVRGGMRSENGVLEINTVFGDDSSPTDKLILDGGVTTGSTGVIVHNRGGTGAETDVGIMIVEAANGATTSPDSFALSSQARNFRAGVGTMAAGAFDYSLLRGGNGGDENSWYLVSRRVARPEAGNYLVAREAAEGLFFHSMFDRLLGYQEYVVPTTGERRLHSAWARMQYGRATQDNCLTGLNSSSNTFVAQTGMDLWRAESNLGAFFAGAMIGFGTASGTITDASIPLPAKSNLDGYLVGGYATWFMDRQRVDGLYVDGWVQHAWFKNRTSGAGLPGERFTTRLWSGSLEAGYAIPLFRTANSAWTVTPTVQLTYNSYKANNFVEATGTEIKFTDRDRFFTTAGFRVKGTVGAPGRLQSEPYVEFKWLRKGKKTRIRMDDHSLSLGSPRNLYEAKLGIDMPIRDTLRVGVNVSGQFGKGNYRRLAGEIGLRLDW
ncbi:MAG: autotransporter outer membrane beta-barrel domain-containing protein, partial [Planctomycetes bacterium]|nr:autotransporter outer membrane beta-barrel domain-containing protein [Planctomycetota bacterium]